jgi:hypothetical protein
MELTAFGGWMCRGITARNTVAAMWNVVTVSGVPAAGRLAPRGAAGAIKDFIRTGGGSRVPGDGFTKLFQNSVPASRVAPPRWN